MTHDITHCEGKWCASKNDCFRYKAHLAIKEDNYELPVSYLTDERECENFNEE